MTSHVILFHKTIIAGFVLICNQTAWTQESSREISKRIVQRGAHHQKIEIKREVKLLNGGTKTETVGYTQIGSGLNRMENGTWVESKEILEQHPLGLIGRSGPFQAIFTHNINRYGSVDILTPDNKRLACTVLGLYVTDTVHGESVLIGEVKDSQAKLIPPNQVIYQDAFRGIKADVRYTYAKGYFEQDVILREKPVLPDGIDLAAMAIEVLTEFVEAPKPTVKLSVQKEDDSGFNGDSKISFGDVQIGQSTGFKAGADGRDGLKTIITKDWVQFGERRFLLETVPFLDMDPLMEGLPQAVNFKGMKTGKMEKMIPKARTLVKNEAKNMEIEVAKLDQVEVGAVLDFVFVYTTPNMTFNSDVTYYISGTVWIDESCEFQEGTILKYAQGATLVIGGKIVCPELKDRPAILTGLSDNTYGENISGMAQDVTKYWAEKALAFYLTSMSPNVTGQQYVRNLDIRDAVSAIEIYGDNLMTVEGCIIEHCQIVIDNRYDNNSFCNFNSGAVYDVLFELQGFNPNVTILQDVIRGGKEKNISQSSSNLAEADVSINPNNTDNIFVLSMHDKVDIKQLKMMETRDGGDNWSSPEQNYTAHGAGFDPSVSFEKDGDLWISYIGQANGGHKTAYAELRKKDSPNIAEFNLMAKYGGLGLNVDRPTIASLAPLPGAGGAEDRDAAWWCLSSLEAEKSYIFVKLLTEDRAANDENSFIKINGSRGARFSYLGVADGALALTSHSWLATNIETSPYSVHLGLGGVTSPSSFNILDEEGNYSFYINMPVNFIPDALSSSGNGVDAEVGVGLDRVNEKLHVVYTDRINAEATNYDSDIYLKTLEGSYLQGSSHGNQWHPVKKINKYGVGKTQFMPRMAIDSETGYLAVAWYDCRDIENTKPQLYIAISKDQGATFLQARVSRGASDYRLNNPNNHFDYGDFIGIAFHDGVVFPVWADNSNSTGDNKGVTQGHNGSSQVEFEIHTRKIVIFNEG